MWFQAEAFTMNTEPEWQNYNTLWEHFPIVKGSYPEKTAAYYNIIVKYHYPGNLWAFDASSNVDLNALQVFQNCKYLSRYNIPIQLLQHRQWIFFIAW